MMPSSNVPTPRRPPLNRGISLPLKSSLKSMPGPPHAQQILRTRSEPSITKHVHFPEKDYALATVRVYNRSARPAALRNPTNGNGDETETDGDDTPPIRFPFPSLSSVYEYEIDPTRSSPVPCKPSPSAHLLLESLHLSSSSSTGPATKPLLTGSILVRNLAFEKHVAIRFTLDDWQTVSEVGARYVNSLLLPPSQIPPSTSEDTTCQRARGWDRFTFAIRLEDYAHSLSTRTLWLAARYHTNSTYPEPGSSKYGPGGEWWDNNGGGNYRAVFRHAIAAPRPPRSLFRSSIVSASISSPRTQLQPPTTCLDHALALIVPSVSDDKADKPSTPMRTSQLDMCNYASSTNRATSILNLSQTSSPASSSLSTPPLSPTIIPRAVGEEPATFTYGPSEENDAFFRLGHIPDWDWSAPSKPQTENADLVPASEPLEQHRDGPPLGTKALHDPYDALVSRCCFAQEPFPSHRAYDGGGIMV